MADNVICTSYNYLPVISVRLLGAKYLRVGNCLFLRVQGWGGEHKVKIYIYIYLQISGGYLSALIICSNNIVSFEPMKFKVHFDKEY